MVRSRMPHIHGTSGYYALAWPSALIPRSVGSREIRYLAVAQLIETGRPMTPVELAAAIQSRGVTIRAAKPNKAVSDALRWELAKGRVAKPARGVYVAGRMPRSTKSWICGRARHHYRLAAEQQSRHQAA